MLLGGLAVGNADCAQERAPVNRVQPAALNKHFYVGRDLRDARDDPEFYMNNFTVDSPASNPVLPVGLYDDVDRIRWEVQENVLLARKAYEYVTGSDGRGVRGPTESGLIVAAYRIESHFDIRNDYNTSTGEQNNVVNENSSDRPWYEREYMRVDWSQNLTDNPDWGGLWFGTLFGNISFQPVRYYVTDPNSPLAPNFCESVVPADQSPDSQEHHLLYNWEQECPAARRVTQGRYSDRVSDTVYFDVTSKWVVNPEMTEAFGEPLPTCLIVNFFTGSDTYDCNPQDVAIRTSFRRVTNRDFEALEMTRAPYDLVGGPRATRNGFDQGYGTTDQNFHRYQMVHNLWTESHIGGAGEQTINAVRPAGVACEGRDLRTPARAATGDEPARAASGAPDGVIDGNEDLNHDGTADACASARAPGSQCDPVANRCTIPYRQRHVRPIVYYINPDMPAEFQDHVETDNGGVLTYRLPTAEDYAARRVVSGATEQLANTWDIAVRRAVASAREVECRKTGGARDTCHNLYFENAQVPMEDGVFLGDNPKVTPGGGAPAVDRAVVLCHNPVRANDHRSCREVGFSARLGDIRYNHITYWSGNSRAPFGGVAHWGFDPLTGEVISNGAFNMGRSVEYAAAQQRDWIRLIMHQLDPAAESLTLEDYVGGAPGAVLAQYFRNPGSSRVGNAVGDTRLSDAEIRDRAMPRELGASAQELAGSVPDMGTDVNAGNRMFDRIVQDTQLVNVTPTHLAADALSRRLQGTQYESDLIAPSTLRSMGFDPRQGLTDSALDAASPLRRLDPERATTLRDAIMARAEQRGMCFQDAGAPASVGSEDLQGVARWFLQKYRGLSQEARRTRILQDLRIDAYKGIALHEIGHSIGLYHLPVSSYDSMNYNPQYWQLRTHNTATAETTACQQCAAGATNIACTNARNADRNTDNCMGPRYMDPTTDEEMGLRPLDAGNHHAGILYFGNTSTMEYQWDRFGETVGLGSYDIYAMGILYGRVMETMDTDPARGGLPVEEQRRFSPRLRTQLANQDYIYWNDPAINPVPAAGSQGDLNPPFAGVHYTELARQMHAFDPARCRDATQAEKDRYRWRLVDGKICSHAPRDHAALADMETSGYFFRNAQAASDDNAAPSWRVREDAPGGNAGAVRWGYRVSWDRGVGYPHINYFDQGADIYETTHSIMLKYDLTYPTSYFRRNNREWQSWNVSQGVSSRLFRLIRGYHWNVARDIAIYRGFYPDNFYQRFAQSEGALGPETVVQRDMFNFFAGVLTRPEVGDFAYAQGTGQFFVNNITPELRNATPRIPVLDVDEDSTMNPVRLGIGLVNGRYIGDEFDNQQGGSWDYNAYANREGTSLEKTFGAIMLMDSRPTFSSVNRHLYLDGRDFLVNFFTDLPDETRRLIGGLMSEDWATVGMYAPTPANGSDSIEVTPLQLNLSGELSNPADPASARILQRPVVSGTTRASNLIYPNFGYRQQIGLGIYSMLYSSLNSTLNIINMMRIWTPGGSEEVTVPPAERIYFTNPDNGVTYVARRYGVDSALTAIRGGIPTDGGVASRMLMHANELLKAAYQTDGTNDDGTPRVVRDANGAPVNFYPASNRQAQQRAIRAFRYYQSVIDATRNISRYLGYGNL